MVEYPYRPAMSQMFFSKLLIISSLLMPNDLLIK